MREVTVRKKIMQLFQAKLLTVLCNLLKCDYYTRASLALRPRGQPWVRVC